MKSKRIQPILLVVGLFLAPLSVAWAGEVPPPGSKPLSEVLESVEKQKLGLIMEAEFDDGLWEVKVCDAGACRKLYIAPKSGEEKRRRQTDSDEMPPVNAMPLSTIIKSVEARGLGIITEVEFDDGFWEVELRKDGRKSDLTIDPRTGETRR
jgi:hypothetical protein